MTKHNKPGAIVVSPEGDMRRSCGKSLYQQEIAARIADYGEQVEFAKDIAANIA